MLRIIDPEFIFSKPEIHFKKVVLPTPAVDETVKTVQCKKESKKGCNGKATKCITHNLWDELETHINSFFEKKSLEDLLKNNKDQRI